MGRPKQYERDDVLERARALFNRQGFAATSIADLVEHLGINRKSLYAEFGDKQALFEACLDRHAESGIGPLVAPLEADDAGVAEIRELLRFWGEGARGRGAGVGCLLCNTASERSASDPASRRRVRAYMRRWTGGFTNALERARERGELARGVDVGAEARFFTSHAMGQLTLIRANVAPETVEAACRVALQHLRSLQS